MDLIHDGHATRRVNSASNPIWMDGLRIALGFFLFFKGIMFLENTSDVFYIFSQQQDLLSAEKADLLTSTVHIIGGLMIAFGALTRLALLCQIPIVLGAVLLVNQRQGVGFENMELWVSVLVVLLLVFFMIVGPGRYSIDNKVFRPKK